MALLNDELIELEFDGLPLNHLFLDTVFCDEAVYEDIFGLTNAVRAVHCLKIDLRVPVRVIQDDMIGGHQIQAKPAGPGRNQKNLLLGAFACKVKDLTLAVL